MNPEEHSIFAQTFIVVNNNPNRKFARENPINPGTHFHLRATPGSISRPSGQ